MDFFGTKKIKNLEREILVLTEYLSNSQNSLRIAHDEFNKLSAQVSEIKNSNFTYDIKSDIPEETNARRGYMSDVTLFYSKIFKKKINHMISLQKDALAIIGKKEQEYDLYRSNINCFSLIDDWMRECEVEHFQNVQIKRDFVEDNSTLEVDNIKNKYSI